MISYHLSIIQIFACQSYQLTGAMFRLFLFVPYHLCRADRLIIKNYAFLLLKRACFCINNSQYSARPWQTTLPTRLDQIE